MLSVFVTIASVALPAILLVRGVQRGLVSRLPFFYSYIAYTFLFTTIAIGLLRFLPQYHPTVYWFGFLVWLVVEFGVIVEISDHIFGPYPAVRRLGRLICGLISATFLVLYILPALRAPAPSSLVMLDLVKRTSLTKAIMILTLLATAKIYKLSIGRSISGVLLGFSICLGVSIANYQLAGFYGRTLYAPILRFVYPLSWILGAIVWLARGRTQRDEAESQDAREMAATLCDATSLDLANRIFDPADYRWLRDELSFPQAAEALARHRKELAIRWLKALGCSFAELVRSPEPLTDGESPSAEVSSWQMLWLTWRFQLLLNYALLVVRLFGPYHRLVPQIGLVQTLRSLGRSNAAYDAVGAERVV